MVSLTYLIPEIFHITFYAIITITPFSLFYKKTVTFCAKILFTRKKIRGQCALLYECCSRKASLVTMCLSNDSTARGSFLPGTKKTLFEVFVLIVVRLGQRRCDTGQASAIKFLNQR